MNSFFRNVSLRSKDSLLKESLESQLVSCVKDIQLDHAHSGQFQSSSEAADSLCTVLEAIFIHGIKESFADKMVIAMGDPDLRPEPNFWPVLLIFSHREFIDQIGRLNYISTDVGRCRAWLRLGLNDSLLSSYLQSMLLQNSALNSFYKRSAYLRDKERLDMLVTSVSGVEAYSFNFACNSSLLNMWTNQPLLMSGIWSPAMKACPITSGTDIAKTLVLEDSARAEDTVSSVLSVASLYESSLGSSAFDEDEALKIILGTDATQSVDESKNTEGIHNYTSNSELKFDSRTDFESSDVETAKRKEDTLGQEAGNSVDRESSPDNNTVNHDTPLTESEVETRKQKLQSYHSLVESYNEKSTTATTMPDLQDLLQKFEMPSSMIPPKSPSNTMITSTGSADSDTINKLEFEVVPENADPPDIPEFRVLLQHLTKIPVEPGLDSQNYTCRTCTHYIGVNFGPARVCGLTGAYYCSDCFGVDPTIEQSVIPARVIYNWDFRQYPVSHKAADFLSQIQLYPLFDLSIINPKIYCAVEEMTRLKELRVRLNFLIAYLMTCRDNAMEPLQRLIWPRDYLYEKIHLYSLSDLIQLSNGGLEGLLQKAVTLAHTHVTSCSLCMQKGFICEKCDDSKVIFPFDLETTYRCKDCSSVYHAQCLQAGQLCPKCLRIQQRELSLSATLL